MSVRIVAGRFGGRRLETPPGRATRPTSERVREAWFSALGPRVAGARVLDLFAGSGALGLEALSRGAEHVHLVEADARAAAVLGRNVKALGAAGACHVVRRDAFAFLRELDRAEGAPFDVAFADPPYGGGIAARVAERYAAAPFAELLCVEHATGALDAFAAVWRRRYGDTELSFLTPPGSGPVRDSEAKGAA